MDEWSSDELLLARSSPSGFGHVVTGGTRDVPGAYLPFAHLRLVNNAILEAVEEQDRVLAGWEAVAEAEGLDERVARELCEGGRFDRLAIEMPPRHGKSETTSRHTPAWYLGSRPDRKVILASYEARFAESWGRKSRDLLELHGREIFGVAVSQKSSAAAQWEIAGRQGGMIAAGVGGPITGKGGHLAVVDDPVKNAEEAASEVMREKIWDWWPSTLRTRLEKGAIVIIVMTRWHEDDLIARLFAHDAEVEEAEEREGWRRISLPAIAEPDEDGEFYDALGRAPGEPLCPELGFHERWARRTRAAVGGYVWYALYQQRPRPPDGLLFKRSDFRYATYVPAAADAHHTDEGLLVLERDDGELSSMAINECVLFQTSDTAASEDEMADYTVVSTWAVTPLRDLVLIHVHREKFEDSRVGAMLSANYRGLLENDAVSIAPVVRRRPPVRITVENASSGPKVIRELGAEGLPVASANPDTDKVTRALLAVARYEQHVVFHLRGTYWLHDFEGELLAFPNSTNDDQVDTVSMAAIELPKIPVGRKPRRERQGGGEFAGIRDKAL